MLDPRALLRAQAGRTPDREWTLEVDGHRLHVEEHGHADAPPLVYLHGLLLSSRLNRALARELVDLGHRVVLLDLLGHGQSDKPPVAYRYRFDTYPRQVAALLDALDRDDVVLGGVSLGAQVALWTGVQHPDRVRGLVLEMPVGELGAPFANSIFIPLMVAARYAPLPFVATSALAGALPSSRTWLDGVADALAQRPETISAVLHGLLVGPIMPPLDDRTSMDVETLVITHLADPLHPDGDAEALARTLPRARLERGRSFPDLRLRPHRLARMVSDFADEVRAG